MPWNLRPGICVHLLALVISTSLLGACSAENADVSAKSVAAAVRNPQTFAVDENTPPWRRELLRKARLSTDSAMQKTRTDDYDENYDGIRVIGIQMGCSAAQTEVMAGVHETGWMPVENVPFPRDFREVTLPYFPSPTGGTCRWSAPPREHFVNDANVFRLYKISGVIRGDIPHAIWSFTSDFGKPQQEGAVSRWCKGCTDVTLRTIDADTAEVVWEYKPLRNLYVQQLVAAAGEWEAEALRTDATVRSTNRPNWVVREDAAMINECPHDYEQHDGVAFGEVPLGASARRTRDIMDAQEIRWIELASPYPGITREFQLANAQPPWPGVTYVERGQPTAKFCMDEGVFRLRSVQAFVKGDVEHMLEQARRIYGEPHASIFPSNQNYTWEIDDTKLSMFVSKGGAGLIYEHLGLSTVEADKEWNFDEHGKGPAVASE